MNMHSADATTAEEALAIQETIDSDMATEIARWHGFDRKPFSTFGSTGWDVSARQNQVLRRFADGK